MIYAIWLAIIAFGLAVGQLLELNDAASIFVLFWALFWLALGITVLR